MKSLTLSGFGKSLPKILSRYDKLSNVRLNTSTGFSPSIFASHSTSTWLRNVPVTVPSRPNGIKASPWLHRLTTLSPSSN